MPVSLTAVPAVVVAAAVSVIAAAATWIVTTMPQNRSRTPPRSKRIYRCSHSFVAQAVEPEEEEEADGRHATLA
jgi:hypothetical protein